MAVNYEYNLYSTCVLNFLPVSDFCNNNFGDWQEFLYGIAL
jgi:hypothetical protein